MELSMSSSLIFSIISSLISSPSSRKENMMEYSILSFSRRDMFFHALLNVMFMSLSRSASSDDSPASSIDRKSVV